ncbi:hypothetical protein DK419_22070 [Methylobacterium terrae]|uniref:Uncharacterized protein n=1 Tax=Methylobacterium terrae TaxID=2202827 RepID=A0A2U8WR89_9HYPH|nr:hypothetical protein DK419_22070 [Methylobacterium terrae]
MIRDPEVIFRISYHTSPPESSDGRSWHAPPPHTVQRYRASPGSPGGGKNADLSGGLALGGDVWTR